MSTKFTDDQIETLDYLVQRGVNQGDAYRAARDATRAVQTTLNKLHKKENAWPLMFDADEPGITSELVAEAAGRIMAIWISWKGSPPPPEAPTPSLFAGLTIGAVLQYKHGGSL